MNVVYSLRKASPPWQLGMFRKLSTIYFSYLWFELFETSLSIPAPFRESLLF